MARSPLPATEQTRIGAGHQAAALALAAQMPRLVVSARRAAHAVLHGLHGRRRAGTGENFWQFRRFSSGEAASRVDWRRSARDDNLYVREREWESAHTVWIWIDRSRSMAFRSDPAADSKVERAVVLGLAMAELLVRAGERVGLLGLTRPTASRNAVRTLAETLAGAPADAGALPPDAPIALRAEAILIGDFYSSEGEIAAAVHGLASRGGRGHILQVSDPIEETFPFSGRTEFLDPDGFGRLTAGRAQDYRVPYERKLAQHRAGIAEIAGRHGWSFLLNRTDRPATEALLALHARLGAEAAS